MTFSNDFENDSFFALQNHPSLSFNRRLAFRKHHNHVHTAERVIHTRIINLYSHSCISLDSDWLNVLFHIHIKQNKNLWRYFLRQRKRSFQTYPAYIAVKIKQNTFGLTKNVKKKRYIFLQKINIFRANKDAESCMAMTRARSDYKKTIRKARYESDMRNKNTSF